LRPIGLLAGLLCLSSWAFASRPVSTSHPEETRVALLRPSEPPPIETGPWLQFDLDSASSRRALSGSWRAPLVAQRKGGVPLGRDATILRLPAWPSEEVAIEWQSEGRGSLVATCGGKSMGQRARPGERMIARIPIRPGRHPGTVRVAYRGAGPARLLAVRFGPTSPTWKARPVCGDPLGTCLEHGSAARFFADVPPRSCP
jgi:hypothetical protein